MIVHGYVPNDMLLSTVIPIPKNKRNSLNNSDNYRAIALSSALGKLLDNVILEKYKEYFQTTDLQYGFKKGHSTSQCTFVLNEVIKYYNNNNTDVNCILLDASKAFDRVEYVKMFNLLLSNGLSVLYCRFLAVLYTNQTLSVKWGNYMSRHINVKNGVKQGGVLSPIMFGVYIDVLIKQLSHSKVGCYIGDLFVGALGYADDLVLLAPTLSATNIMLNLANQFEKDYCIEFNSNKTKFLLFAYEEKKIDRIVFTDHVIQISKCEKHLGNFIGDNANSVNIVNSMNNFASIVNYITSVYKYAHYDVKVKLFHCYAMLFYGSVLWDFASPEFKNVYSKWRDAIRRLLDLSPISHCNLLPLLCDTLPFDVFMYKRFLKFINNNIKCENNVVKICTKLMSNGSGTSCSNNYSFICRQYNLEKHDSNFLNKFLTMINIYEDDPNDIAASIIIDLLRMKSEVNKFFTISQINDIINYVCRY